MNLLQREVAKKYREMSLGKIIKELSDIKEILLFYPDTMKPERKISKSNDTQQRLYQILNLNEFALERIGQYILQSSKALLILYFRFLILLLVKVRINN